MALASLGRTDEARTELDFLATLTARVPEQLMANLNPAPHVLAVAQKVLEARITEKDGRSAEAIVLYREAVALEDRLSYAEPADWFYPTRHFLGAALLDADRPAEAEAVFRKALGLAPDNAAAAQIVAHLFATAEEPTARGRETDASWAGIGDPALLLQEGSSRLVAGDAAGAYPLLRRASAALPEEPSAWYNLGLAAKKTERWEEAVSALQRALALRADWPPALRALADTQAKAGSCPAAVLTARRAAEVDAANPDPYVTLFNCLQAMGDHAGAQAAKAEHDRMKAAAGK